MTPRAQIVQRGRWERNYRKGLRSLPLILATGIVLLSPLTTSAQYGPGGQAPRDPRECDPFWDGALWGLLPGVLAGGVLIIVSQSGDQDSSKVIVASAALGVLGGLLIDGATCNPLVEKDGEQFSLLTER